MNQHDVERVENMTLSHKKNLSSILRVVHLKYSLTLTKKLMSHYQLKS